MPVLDELAAVEERERWDRQLRELLRLVLQSKNRWRAYQTRGQLSKGERYRLEAIQYLKKAIIMLELE